MPKNNPSFVVYPEIFTLSISFNAFPQGFYMFLHVAPSREGMKFWKLSHPPLEPLSPRPVKLVTTWVGSDGFWMKKKNPLPNWDAHPIYWSMGQDSMEFTGFTSKIASLFRTFAPPQLLWCHGFNSHAQFLIFHLQWSHLVGIVIYKTFVGSLLGVRLLMVVVSFLGVVCQNVASLHSSLSQNASPVISWFLTLRFSGLVWKCAQKSSGWSSVFQLPGLVMTNSLRTWKWPWK